MLASFFFNLKPFWQKLVGDKISEQNKNNALTNAHQIIINASFLRPMTVSVGKIDVCDWLEIRQRTGNRYRSHWKWFQKNQTSHVVSSARRSAHRLQTPSFTFSNYSAAFVSGLLCAKATQNLSHGDRKPTLFRNSSALHYFLSHSRNSPHFESQIHISKTSTLVELFILWCRHNPRMLG